MTFQTGYNLFLRGLSPQGSQRRDPEIEAGWQQAKRDHPITDAVRAERFGDADLPDGQRLYEDALVERHLAGLPLSRHAAKHARRIIRERKETA